MTLCTQTHRAYMRLCKNKNSDPTPSNPEKIKLSTVLKAFKLGAQGQPLSSPNWALGPPF